MRAIGEAFVMGVGMGFGFGASIVFDVLTRTNLLVALGFGP